MGWLGAHHVGGSAQEQAYCYLARVIQLNRGDIQAFGPVGEVPSNARW